MTSKIVPLIPKHTVYVEPFAGGAAVFFSKPWPAVTDKSHYREVINDKDERLVNFYRVLQDDGDELVRRLSLTLYSEAEYRRAKDLSIGDDAIDAAARYFVNVNQSFVNKINGGWGRSVFGQNTAATWATCIERLPEYLDRMATVHIACDDALKIIKQWDSPQTFFYCDPPYPKTNCGDYKGYEVADLQQLVNTLEACQGSFILSNYDQPGIVWPDGWERHEFKAHCSSSGRVGYDRSKKMDESGQNRERTQEVRRMMARVQLSTEIKALYDSGKFDCFTGDQPRQLSFIDQHTT
jgi:DNA adenine methylase